MSDAVLVAVIALVPSLIGLSNSKRLAEIHILVNSNLTAVKEALTSANAKIERLESALETFQKENL